MKRNQSKAVILATQDKFIWRGCIRKGEPMKVLILSKRMRCLLENWLDEESV